MSILRNCLRFKLAAERYSETGSVELIEKLAQLFQNYDYIPGHESGPGVSVYRAMNDGEVKSISEWRKKNRDRRRKNLEKIKKTKLI